jgi:hypothetical protein
VRTSTIRPRCTAIQTVSIRTLSVSGTMAAKSGSSGLPREV